MRNSGTIWIIAGIMLLLDVYVFQAVKTVTQGASERTRLWVNAIYWVVSALTIILLLSFPYIQSLQNSKFFRNYIFASLVGLFIAKLIGVLFFMIDDIRRGIMWLMSKVAPSVGAHFVDGGDAISRSSFLSWLGLGAGATLFFAGTRPPR